VLIGHLIPSERNERLAVIDSAQKNLGELTTQVTSLRDVLANKQARGAFGDDRYELAAGDSVYFAADVPHGYANHTDTECSYHVAALIMRSRRPG
jgi:uncharacterized RmlC-like cupin family protein